MRNSPRSRSRPTIHSKIVHAQRAQERRASDDAFNRLFINTGGEGNPTAELVAHTSGSEREIYNAASVVEDVQLLEANSDRMESGDDIEQVTVGERPCEGNAVSGQAPGQDIQPFKKIMVGRALMVD